MKMEKKFRIILLLKRIRGHWIKSHDFFFMLNSFIKILLSVFSFLFELVLVDSLLPYSEGQLNTSIWHDQCTSLCVTSCPIYACSSHDKGLPDGM